MTCPICCKLDVRGGVWNEIYGFSLLEVQDMVKEMAGLTLVDMGAGDGTVLGSVLSDTKQSLESQSIIGLDKKFNHIVAIEPSDTPFSAGKDEQKINRIIPLKIECKDLPSLLTEHKLDQIGLFVSWPDPEKEYDIEAVRLLRPQKMVFLVGTYEEKFPNKQGPYVTASMAGSPSLHNNLLAPIISKEMHMFEGTRYRLQQKIIKELPDFFTDISADKDEGEPRNARHMLLLITREN